MSPFNRAINLGFSPSITASDDFNRANGALGSYWTAATDGAPTISGNKIIGPGTAAHRGAAVSSGSFTNDQFSQVDGVVLALNDYVAVSVRDQASGQTGYFGLFLRDSLGYHIQLYKRVTGTFTILTIPLYPSGTQNATVDVSAPATGDVFRVEVVGSNIVVKLNGVVVLSAIDTSIASGGRPGVAIYQTGACDNWQGGSFAPPPAGVPDDFARLDGALGAGWIPFGLSGGLLVKGNECIPQRNQHYGSFRAGTWNNNQYSEVQVGSVAVKEGDFIGPCVRVQNNGADFYCCFYFCNPGNGCTNPTPSNHSLYLYKRRSNTFAEGTGGFLTSGDTFVNVGLLAAGAKIRLTAIGNTISAYVNNVLKAQGTDSDLPSGGAPGMFAFGGSPQLPAFGASLDKFDGGNL